MIKLTDVNKSFSTINNAKPVLNHLSLTISEGDRILIMGESGCGKTTLLNILAGLLAPNSGSFQVGPPFRPIDYTNERERAALRYECIGFVPQNFCLVEHNTVAENIYLAQKIRKIESPPLPIPSLLKQLNLEDISHEKVKHLSMGQKQRVAIARAITVSPALLLADEPTSALDEETSRIVLTLIAEQCKTFILVSHDSRIASICNRVYRLDHGKLLPRHLEHCFPNLSERK